MRCGISDLYARLSSVALRNFHWKKWSHACYLPWMCSTFRSQFVKKSLTCSRAVRSLPSHALLAYGDWPTLPVWLCGRWNIYPTRASSCDRTPPMLCRRACISCPFDNSRESSQFASCMLSTGIEITASCVNSSKNTTRYFDIIQTKTTMNSDIFDDIAPNYLGRVVKAGDCNQTLFVSNNRHTYLANKHNHILKRLIRSCTEFYNFTTIVH